MKRRSSDRRWLLLSYQLPARPAYLRVKVWRRLQALGAAPIKNSVYGLPLSAETQEDFSWLLREIRRNGGDGCLWEGRLLEGTTDTELEASFDAARNADYEAISVEARKALRRRTAKPDDLRAVARIAVRLRRRLEEATAIDFFSAPARRRAEQATRALEIRLGSAKRDVGAEATMRRPRGAVWVTRRDVHVDRIASAWLIARHIDPDVRFKFVSASKHRPRAGEIRFDMFDGEFTHEGDRCTFEVLLQRFQLDRPELSRIAEIVHDLDLKDGKFGRPESVGVAQVLNGILLSQRDDRARLARGMALFDDLLIQYRRSVSRRPRRGKPR